MRKRIVFSLMASILLLLSACGSIPGMEGGSSYTQVDQGGSSGGSSSGGSTSSSDGTYHVGDTISTAFFDFTVNSAVASADHEGYTAQDGYKLVVADLTIKNTETYSMPMGQYDFMIAWGDGDEDFAYPLNQYCESQLADEYEIPIAGSAEGSLVFEVPSDQKDFALGFEEYYEDESVGDLYVVYFTAE